MPLDKDANGQLRGFHVLVVDDNRDARYIVQVTLRYAGALVSAAASARWALRVLKTVRPDVILTDLSMPRRDGIWLVQQIRARGPRRGGDVPIVAVTARDDLYGEDDVRAAGVDAVLVKPVSHQELIAAVRHYALSRTLRRAA